MFIATCVWNHSSGGFIALLRSAKTQVTTPVYRHLAPTKPVNVTNAETDFENLLNLSSRLNPKGA
jgi:hypothetical protein